MTDQVKAWQCIGCGAIEAPQPCVGICEFRRVEFVYGAEHRDALARAEHAEARANALASVVRRLARTTPHADGWERSFRALQAEARRALGEDADHAP